MDPNNQPQVFGPVPANDPPLHSSPQPKTPRYKRLAIIVGAVLGVLIVIIIAAAALSGDSKKPAPNATETPQAQGPQPARAIDVEEASNSINSDISSQDHNKNFPADELDDKSLKL